MVYPVTWDVFFLSACSFRGILPDASVPQSIWLDRLAFYLCQTELLNLKANDKFRLLTAQLTKASTNVLATGLSLCD